MKNLKIGTKLFLAFGIVSLVLVLSDVLGMVALSENDRHLGELAKANDLADTSMKVVYNISRIVSATKELALAKNGEDKKKLLDQIGHFRNGYKENLAFLAKNAPTPEAKEFAEKLQQEVALGKEASLKLIDLAMHDNLPAFVDVLQKESNPRNERIFVICEQMQKYFISRMDLSNEGAEKSNHQARIILLAFSICTVLFSAFVSWYSTRAITVPIGECLKAADRIAEGDLSTTIVAHGKDETALLMKAVQHISDSLKGTISALNRAATDISSTSGHLNATAADMAEGSEDVVSQAESVATAGEEMAATALDIANNCQSAAASANEAHAAATNGFQVVEKTIRVMGVVAERVKSAAGSVEGLGNRSEQIGAIIGTIEDIADQTNLLALNAAIEAARAGEQGRGFAVVADEVRALAERTSKATREISGMIKTIQEETRGAVTAMEDGVQEVEKGTHEAAKSGEALQAILDQINAVTQQANQIATAAEEQTATTTGISGNMQRITGIVQRSAAGAAETADSASHLLGLAGELNKIVGQFRVA